MTSDNEPRRVQLIEAPSATQSEPALQCAEPKPEDRAQLIRELELHRVELESQNAQLRDAQRSLEESRARYADLYDLAPVAYCTFDQSACIVDINLAGAGLVGRARETIVGQPFASFLPADQRHFFRSHVAQVCEHGVATSCEIRIGEDEPRVFQVASTPFKNGGSTVRGCRAAFMDITARKDAEEALRSSVQMREHFLAVVSHELRNPLNSILMSVELLLEKVPLGERRRLGKRQLEMIGRASKRMTRLVADLLDLSSMDSGHLAIEAREQSLSELVAGAIELISPVAAEKSISVRTQIDPSIAKVTVPCDRERIIQVLLNLASNAVKFTSVGGDLTVGASLRGSSVMLFVRDNGIGMSSDQVRCAFEPYWRARTLRSKGAGLGLSIAKSIVTLHRGEIWAESVLNVGTTVCFTLPRTASDRPTLQGSDGAAPERQGTTAECANPVRRPKILIVDDEEDTRDSLVELLRARGYDLRGARDGAEALSILAREPIDLVLLDLVMPDMDGWTFLAKRDASAARVPVILVSGQADAASVAEMQGLAARLEKPLVFPKLLVTIERILQSAVVDSQPA